MALALDLDLDFLMNEAEKLTKVSVVLHQWSTSPLTLPPLKSSPLLSSSSSPMQPPPTIKQICTKEGMTGKENMDKIMVGVSLLKYKIVGVLVSMGIPTQGARGCSCTC